MTNINEISDREQYNQTDISNTELAAENGYAASNSHPDEFGENDPPEDEDEFDDTDLDSNNLEDDTDLWSDDLEDDTDLEEDDDTSTGTDFTGYLEDEDASGNALFFK